MDEERKFEETREITFSSTETESKHDLRIPKENYGLSEEGKLLSQEKSIEDEKTTIVIPPSNNEDVSSPAVVGTTHFSNVRSIYRKSGNLNISVVETSKQN